MNQTDYRSLARSSSQADFVAACACPFLLSADTLARPPGPQPTLHGVDIPDLARIIAGERPAPRRPETIVLAVKKVTTAFPSMITIGRTSNHDIVISDVEVSKFHAFFREAGGGFELLDAGSSNGTWVGEERLQKRDPRPVAFGDVVRFGRLRFHFLHAGGCWEALRSRGA